MSSSGGTTGSAGTTRPFVPRAALALLAAGALAAGVALTLPGFGALVAYAPGILLVLGAIALVGSLGPVAFERARSRRSVVVRANRRAGSIGRAPLPRTVLAPRRGAAVLGAPAASPSMDLAPPEPAVPSARLPGDVLWTEWIPEVGDLPVNLVGPVPETAYLPPRSVGPVGFSPGEPELFVGGSEIVLPSDSPDGEGFASREVAFDPPPSDAFAGLPVVYAYDANALAPWALSVPAIPAPNAGSGNPSRSPRPISQVVGPAPSTNPEEPSDASLPAAHLEALDAVPPHLRGAGHPLRRLPAGRRADPPAPDPSPNAVRGSGPGHTETKPTRPHLHPGCPVCGVEAPRSGGRALPAFEPREREPRRSGASRDPEPGSDERPALRPLHIGAAVTDPSVACTIVEVAGHDVRETVRPTGSTIGRRSARLPA